MSCYVSLWLSRNYSFTVWMITLISILRFQGNLVKVLPFTRKCVQCFRNDFFSGVRFIERRNFQNLIFLSENFESNTLFQNSPGYGYEIGLATQYTEESITKYKYERDHCTWGVWRPPWKFGCSRHIFHAGSCSMNHRGWLEMRAGGTQTQQSMYRPCGDCI
jgi:hypothetical protein